MAERTQALQKAMEEKDAFLAVLTHDMKSLLTSIHLKGHAERVSPCFRAETPLCLMPLFTARKRLTELSNNILDLEKLAQGELTVEKEVFEFSAVATNVFHIVRASSGEAKMKFSHGLLAQTGR
ncbi:MAG: hypothetical protein R3D55_11420 [Chloroflexota bacterium]